MSNPAGFINPTVGRKLYLRPPVNSQGQPVGLYNVISPDQPLDATILYVHNERTINVMITDHRGNQRFADFVHLVQGDDEDVAASKGYCYWMPYQKAVAKGDTPALLHSTDAPGTLMGLYDSPVERIEDLPGGFTLPFKPGDPVHYFPGVHDILNRDRRNKALAATVSRVNEDASLNLLVLDVRRGITLERNMVRENPMDPLIEGYFGAVTSGTDAFSMGFDQGAFA